MNTKEVRIRKTDLDNLRDGCKKLYLQANPNMADERLSDSFMLNKVISYYMEE